MILDSEDQSGAQNISTRSANAELQTNWPDLPRMFVRYGYNENINNLDLLGTGTRQSRIGAGLDYAWRTFGVHYDYEDRLTRNQGSGLELYARQHIGRVDQSVSLFRRNISLSTSYQVLARAEREVQPLTGDLLIPVGAVAGLYAIDPSPDFDALTSLSGLIDGNLDSAASRLLDLSGAEVLNVGLDFGTPVRISNLYLNTDSLAPPQLRWAIYASRDNLTWELLRGPAAYPFNIVFERYEIAFDPVSTRYIKLVLEPLPQERSVFVTELRAFVVRDGDAGEQWRTDHQASATFAVRPARWISASVDGNFFKNDPGATILGREQSGLVTGLRLAPHSLSEWSAQYLYNRTNYDEPTSDRTENDQVNITLRSRWSATLHSTASATRQREYLAGRHIRRMDGALLRLDARILPDLRGTTTVGATEDHRFEAVDLYKTRYIDQSVDARPTPRSQVSGSYRITTLDSERGNVPGFRESFSVAAGYFFTSLLQTRANAVFNNEGGRRYFTWDGVLSWSATPKLTLSGSVNRIDPTANAGSTLLSAQAYFLWSARADVNVSYSVYSAQAGPQENYSSIRFGFNLRF